MAYALFDNYSFLQSNPVSRIMQNMLDVLHDNALEKEQETLDKFYASVQERAKGIDNAEGKQKIIIELYEQFFKNALPKETERLGIVYTPVEVVDFIIQSVEYVMQQRFGRSISDKGVHVLDPFTGTGTFIVRLLRSGIIKPEDLLYKYTSEIHCNEIVLLAYYIAAVNIEETYHELSQSEDYVPFEGIVLTDTFELAEHSGTREGEADTSIFQPNSDRAVKQMQTPIQVIIGNPPYSVGQKSGNDNNQNVSYPNLDKAVMDTYAAQSGATLRRSLYDSYIKAFRWATDRIEENGIIGFVTNGQFIDADDLSKGVTRIPTLAHFVDYVRIGRELADLHLKYEKPVSAEELGVTIEMHKEDYTVVDRMRFGKGKDKSIIEYNPYITIRNIPAEAYNYIVNGKSAIEWILEQYAVTTDKASGIVNDPNTYAGGKYIFDLLLSIISVSLKTQELIAQLPEYKEI